MQVAYRKCDISELDSSIGSYPDHVMRVARNARRGSFEQPVRYRSDGHPRLGYSRRLRELRSQQLIGEPPDGRLVINSELQYAIRTLSEVRQRVMHQIHL